jgi:hypothetical protein
MIAVDQLDVNFIILYFSDINSGAESAANA